jgi:hypothetical protein
MSRAHDRRSSLAFVAVGFVDCKELEVVSIRTDHLDGLAISWDGGNATQIQVFHCPDPNFCSCSGNDGEISSGSKDLTLVWSIYSYDDGITSPVRYGEANGAEVEKEPEELLADEEYLVSVVNKDEFTGCVGYSP